MVSYVIDCVWIFLWFHHRLVRRRRRRQPPPAAAAVHSNSALSEAT